MGIEENIAARRLAELAMELVIDLIKESNESASVKASAFWKLADMIDEITQRDRSKDSPVDDQPLSDSEKRRFEAQMMPFGKYSANGEDPKTVGDVPISYLVWLHESDEFRNHLRRYLKRPEVWEQQEVKERF